MTDNMATNNGTDKDKGNAQRTKFGPEGGLKYGKERTVVVELIGEDKITTMELLRSIKDVCGELVGCRIKGERKYEVTMRDAKGKERLMDGFKIKNTKVMARDVMANELIVSFMNLPVYIEDGAIVDKLRSWGVAAVSEIRRRVWPGTEIVDGTRYCKVKFTDTVQSLPYSTKFETLEGGEYFRVIHDKQVRVCRLCIQPGHILKDCPDFRCFKCGNQGHYARECAGARERAVCAGCRKRTDECNCGEVANEEESQDLFMEADEASRGEEEDGKENVEESGEMQKMEQKTDETGSSMGSEMRRGSFQEEGEIELGGGTGDAQILGEGSALASTSGGEDMEGSLILTTVPETERDTGSTSGVGGNKLSWLDDMDLEEISDTEDGEKIERLRERYRKRKMTGGEKKEGGGKKQDKR